MAPGEARVLSLALPGHVDEGDAIPVWAAAGLRPGPRITVVAAPRGFEISAARSALILRAGIDPTVLSGSIAVVPVFRPGGRFAARGQPLRELAAWRFPGDPGGNRRAREAFVVFSELVVGSSVLLLLTAPDPGRTAALTVRGNLDDPRVRRLAHSAGAAVALHVKRKPGTLVAAATEMGAAVLELSALLDDSVGGGIDALVSAARGILAAAGSLSCAQDFGPRRPRTVTRLTVIRAPMGGLLEDMVAAGQVVERGGLLARVASPLGARAVDIRAPHDSLVVEAGTRSAVRVRATLFLLGRVPRAVVAREQRRNGTSSSAIEPAVVQAAAAAPRRGRNFPCGWAGSSGSRCLPWA